MLSLGYYRGPLRRVLAALDQPALEGALLELDGDPSEELLTFAEELTADDPDLQRVTHDARHGTWRLGPISFGSKPLLLPLGPGVLDRLQAMCEHHADPEIALALRVLDATGTLVDAPDVGDNEIWVTSRVDEQTTSAVQAALGLWLTTDY